MIKTTQTLPMNLQFFAEDDGAPIDDQGKEQDEGKQASERAEKAPKTFTQDEVNNIVQKRLERAMKDQQQKIDDAKNEAAKLAKMNTQQKQQYEMEKLQQTAQDAQAKLNHYEMRDTAKQLLIDGGFSNPNDDILNMVVTDKAETTQKNAQAFLKMVEGLKEQIRNDLLKGNTPKVSGNAVKPKTAQDVLRMSASDRVKFQHENPDQFNKLFS